MAPRGPTLRYCPATELQTVYSVYYDGLRRLIMATGINSRHSSRQRVPSTLRPSRLRHVSRTLRHAYELTIMDHSPSAHEQRTQPLINQISTVLSLPNGVVRNKISVHETNTLVNNSKILLQYCNFKSRTGTQHAWSFSKKDIIVYQAPLTPPLLLIQSHTSLNSD